MTDDEIRALVRDAITRHLGDRGSARPADGGRPFRGAEGAQSPGQPTAPFDYAQGSLEQRRGAPPPWRAHASFGRFLVTSGTEEGGPCLIEPTVRCNHCGYCQSYGH